MKIGRPEFLRVNPATLVIEQHRFELSDGRIDHHVNGVLRANVAAKHFPAYVAAMDCAAECKFTPSDAVQRRPTPSNAVKMH